VSDTPSDRALKSGHLETGNRRSIARRLMITTALIGFLITLVTISIQAYFQYRSDIENIEAQFRQIGDSHLSSVSSVVWALDELLIKLNMTGLLGLPAIEYLEVSSSGGARWVAGKKIDGEAIVRDFALTNLRSGIETKFASMRVEASLTRVYAGLVRHTLQSLLSTGLLIFCVIGAIYVLFRRTVTRHLDSLAGFAGAIDLDKEIPRFKLDRKKSNSNRDELDTVVDAINDMVQKVIETSEGLRESEGKYRASFDTAHDAIITTDAGGIIVNWNTAAENIFGYDRSEVIGQSVDLLGTAADKSKAERAGRKWYDGPSGRNGETVIETTALTSLDVEVHVDVSTSSWIVNNQKHLTITIRDVTRRKKAEEHQASLAEQLRQAQKMEAVGQLTGGIAHDFNNILAIVMGNLEIGIDMIGKESKAYEYFDMAMKGSERAATLTKRLLGFSRKESVETRVTLVNEFILDLKDLVERTLTSAISVETWLADDLWPVIINPHELEEALLNLAINARDAMPNGGLLTIETENKVLDDHYMKTHPGGMTGEFVMITVQDSGTGIDAEHLEKVFEPFFSTKETGKGTGLGLSMVYGFVQRSKGHIDIYSEVGEGTAFRIFLPRVTVELSSSSKKEEAVKPAPEGTETILIVDDERSLLRVTEVFMASLGYKTHTAGNGREAMEIIDSEKPVDLVFSDVVMPGGIDGYHLANLAREKRPEIRILLTSGFTPKKKYNDFDRYSFDQKLRDNLLTKPYNRYELAMALREALDAPKED
jgi:PAS domain S-box-containing protein